MLKRIHVGRSQSVLLAAVSLAMFLTAMFPTFAAVAGEPAGNQQERAEAGRRSESTLAGKIRVVELAPLPAPVTSFGATIANGHLYVFGGHLGKTHKYSSDQQSKQLLRLNLHQKTAAWEVIGTGPGRTGLSMVAYAGQLYRIGGWEAKNAAGDEAQLHSSRDFARFDFKSGTWQDLAPLPEGRSSHDSAVLGSQLYVIGGWEMQGGEGEYHATAYVCDLAVDNPRWKALSKPPFSRRALAVAAWQGKIYVIGGMDDSNDATTATNVFDPKTQQWSDGPPLPGKPIDGFGSSAFGTPYGLFATTKSGLLVRLSSDGKRWEEVGKLNHPRIAHRLLATEDGALVAVGGAGPNGKVAEVEAIRIDVAAVQP